MPTMTTTLIPVLCALVAITTPLFAGEPAPIAADEISGLREQWLDYLGGLPAEKAPLAARWKLIRNGMPLSESTGSTFDVPINQPGRYRIELWLDVAGAEHIWILSNPFYVTGESNK